MEELNERGDVLIGGQERFRAITSAPPILDVERAKVHNTHTYRYTCTCTSEFLIKLIWCTFGPNSFLLAQHSSLLGQMAQLHVIVIILSLTALPLC